MSWAWFDSTAQTPIEPAVEVSGGASLTVSGVVVRSTDAHGPNLLSSDLASAEGYSSGYYTTNATLDTTTSEALSGRSSFRLTQTASTYYRMWHEVTDLTPLTVGKTITIMAAVKPEVSTTGMMNVGTNLSNNYGTEVELPAGVWTTISKTYVVESGCDVVNCEVFLRGDGSAIAYIDRLAYWVGGSGTWQYPPGGMTTGVASLAVGNGYNLLPIETATAQSTDGLHSSNNCTVSVSTAQAAHGTTSFLLTQNDSTWYAANWDVSYLKFLPVGTRVTVQAEVRATINTSGVVYVETDTGVHSTVVSYSANTWTRVSTTYFIEPGQTYVYFGVAINGGGTDTAYIDKLAVWIGNDASWEVPTHGPNLLFSNIAAGTEINQTPTGFRDFTGGAVLTSSTTRSVSGSRSLQASIANGRFSIGQFDETLAPARPGVAYSVGYDCYPGTAPTGGYDWTVYVEFRDATKALISWVVVGSKTLTPNAWNGLFGTVVAPPGTRYLMVAPYREASAGSTSESAWIDNLYLWEGAPATWEAPTHGPNLLPMTVASAESTSGGWANATLEVSTEQASHGSTSFKLSPPFPDTWWALGIDLDGLTGIPPVGTMITIQAEVYPLATTDGNMMISTELYNRWGDNTNMTLPANTWTRMSMSYVIEPGFTDFNLYAAGGDGTPGTVYLDKLAYWIGADGPWEAPPTVGADLVVSASLNASGIVVDSGGSGLTAVATLTASATVSKDVTVSVSVTSSLSSSGYVASTRTVAMSSTASLAATGIVVDSGTVFLDTITFTLSSSGVVVDNSTVALPIGTAALYSAGYVSLGGAEQSLTATGSLTADGVVIDSTTATVDSGVGSLTASGTVDWYVSSSSTTIGSLTSAEVAERNGTGSWLWDATLSSTALVTDEGTGILAGVGGLTVDADVSVGGTTSSLTSAAGLTAAAVRVPVGDVSLTATGSLDSEPRLDLALSGSAGSSATLTTVAVAGRNGESSLGVVASLTGIAQKVAAATTELSSTASTSVVGVVVDEGSAFLTEGIGSLTASGLVVSSRSSSVGVSGSLTVGALVSLAGASVSASAEASIVSSGVVIDSGDAVLSQPVADLLTNGSVVTLVGGVLPSAVVSLTGTGLVTDEGTGILTGFAGLTSSGYVEGAGQAGTVTATTTLDGAGVRVPVGTADVSAVGALSSSSTLAAMADASMVGSASMVGHAVRIVAVEAVLGAVAGLVPVGLVERLGSVAISADAGIQADPRVAANASSALSSAGTLTASGLATGAGGGFVTAAADLTSSATVVDDGTSSVSATFDTQSAAHVVSSGLVSQEFAGSLTSMGLVTDTGELDLSASALFSADGSRVISSDAVGNVIASLTSMGLVTDSADVLESADANLVGSSFVEDSTTALPLSGASHLSVIAVVVSVGGSVQAQGAANLNATADVPVVATTSLSAEGVLTAQGSVSLAFSTGMQAQAGLSVTGLVTDEGAGILTAVGGLSADGYVHPAVQGQAQITGQALLDCSAQVLSTLAVGLPVEASVRAVGIVGRLVGPEIPPVVVLSGTQPVVVLSGAQPVVIRRRAVQPFIVWKREDPIVEIPASPDGLVVQGSLTSMVSV